MCRNNVFKQHYKVHKKIYETKKHVRCHLDLI